MSRGPARCGALLVGAALVSLGLDAPAWGAEAVRLWVAPGVSADRATAAAALLGHDAFEVEPLSALSGAVGVVQVVDRRIELLCGGPVELDAWRGRVQAGRDALQGLDVDGALVELGLAEAELPCVTARLAPGDAFGFYLALTEAHLTAARVHPAQAEAQTQAAAGAASRAASAGPMIQAPADTLPAAVEALGRARAAVRGQAPARVVVAGELPAVWWDGQAARASMQVLPGSHVVQLTDQDGTVVAVELVELRPGAAVVIWARPDAVSLDQAGIDAAVSLLATEGRAPVGLAAALAALAPSLVVTGDARQVRLWGEEAGRVRLRLVDPPDAELAPEGRGRNKGGSKGGSKGRSKGR